MKNKSLLVACAVFLVVSGWYGSSVLSDLGSWNDWDKPAQIAKLWKAGIFGIVGFLLALGVDVKSLLGPFGQFLPGTTPAETKGVKEVVCLLLALTLLGTSACATVPTHAKTPVGQALLDHLPKRPDGSLDVQELVNWTKDGINIVCDYDPTSQVCTVGMRVVQLLATKGQDPRVVLAAALEAEDQFPVIRAYTRWFTDTLTHWIALLTAAPA